MDKKRILTDLEKAHERSDKARLRFGYSMKDYEWYVIIDGAVSEAQLGKISYALRKANEQ